MPNVVGVHFVCDNDRNVTDHGNGTFDSGFWVVAKSHRPTIEYLALHSSRSSCSYRQGRVIGARDVKYGGKIRTIFTVQATREPLDWVGNGSGERGYKWR
jgi:hypothetical protein